MSIKQISESKEEGKITIDIDNGHLEALRKIISDYDIADVEKALGFILAVVSKGQGKPIKVGEDTFIPGEAIKNKKESGSETISS